MIEPHPGTEQEQVSECSSLISRLNDVVNGQHAMIISAAMGHVIGQMAIDPDQLELFIRTLASNAELYIHCTCGECPPITKH